jgi:hypothetical protein
MIKNDMEFSKLQALGVPLDGEVLERIRAASLGLSIHTFETAADAFIADTPVGGALLAIHVVIANDSPRVIRIHQFRVGLPWIDPDFTLLADPRHNIPREQLYWSAKDPTLRFNREAVLNHRTGSRGRLAPGESIDGILFGAGEQAIPEPFHNSKWVEVTLGIVDGRGTTHQALVRTALDRSAGLTRQKRERVKNLQTKPQSNTVLA